MSIKYKDGANERTITGVKYQDGGTLRTLKAVWYQDGATLRKVFSGGPSVIIAALKSITTVRFTAGTAYAGVKVDADGGLYSGDINNSYSSYETWLDSGLNTEVWVERTISSGTLTSDAGSGRLACSTDRTFYISTTSNKTAVIVLNFYDAASGGTLLDSQTVTLDANVELFE